MAKKSNVPEKNIDDGELVDLAKQALDHRAQIAEHTTQEKALCETIAQRAEGIRQQEIDQTNYIGIIRITKENQPPIRVEFRMENGALNVSEEANLNALYQGSRPVLFKREKVVTGITDPEHLLQELIADGKNPFDYLELKVRDGMDHALVEMHNVTSAEAFLPVEGFLNTIDGIKGTLSDEAKTYTKNYLAGALKARVVLGSKGKA